MSTRSSCMSLSSILRDRASREGQRAVYTFLSQTLETQATWTYSDLHCKATLLASRIQKVSKPGDRILLLFHHGPEFIASFLGCLYAKVIAVPLQPLKGHRDLPRLQAIAHDTGAMNGITTSSLLPKISSLTCSDGKSRINWVLADIVDGGIGNLSLEESQPLASDVAYLQYTSGSTGSPRGVMITHENIISNLMTIDEDFCHTADTIGVTWLPHYHDMGLVYGLLQPLYNGFPCYVLSPLSFVQRPLCWLEAISRYRATHSGGPNFAYELCTRRILPSERAPLDLSTWRIAFNGAEPVRQETINRFSKTFAICKFESESFYPTYGLAEATLKVTGGLFTRHLQNDSEILESGQNIQVSCGAPSVGTEVCIVDPISRNELPNGQCGEIWVRGPGVAKGYWNRPAETQEVFEASLTASLRNGEDERRFLRTGDLGVLNGNRLIVSGRLKDVIIIRGQCHHPEDIEWTVHKSKANKNGKYLAAFTVDMESEERLVLMQEVGPHLPDKIEEVLTAIRQTIALEHALQVYAIAFVVHIPKTSSGKVKRHACRVMFQKNDKSILHINVKELQGRDSATECSSNQCARKYHTYPASIAQVKRVLMEKAGFTLKANLSDLDLDIPLAALGVDSLGALEICYAIQQTFGVDIALSTAIDSTLSEISNRIMDSLIGGKDQIADRGHEHLRDIDVMRLPVSPEQERLWLMQNLAPKSSAYNLVASVRIHGELNLALLQSAFCEVVEKHQYLQAIFVQIDGELCAQVVSSAKTSFRIVDLRNCGDIDEEGILRHVREDADQPFDISSGPPIRPLLIRLNERNSIASFTFHHIVADAWSLRIFLRDLFANYSHSLQNEAMSESKSVATGYSQFAVESRESLYSRELETHICYWERTLEGAPSVLPLRLDAPRPTIRTHRAEESTIVLDSEIYGKLCAFAEKERTTPYVVLLAAYAILLNQISDAEDIVLASSIANRDRVEFRDMIGLFAHPLFLRLNLKGDATLREIVLRARLAVLGAMKHHTAPYAAIVERLRPERRPGQMPLAQVFFGFAPTIVEKRSIGGLVVEPYGVPRSCTDYDLDLNVMEEDKGLVVRLHCPLDIFKTGTAMAVLGLYKKIVLCLLDNPSMHLLECNTSARIRDSKSTEKPLDIYVASTFVSEPVEEFLSFWMREFSCPLEIKFAQFGQVFQPLLGAEGRWGNEPTGVRVFLLRVEDWATGSQCLRQTVHEFVDLIHQAAENCTAPHLVCICPRSPKAALDIDLSLLISEGEQILTEGLASAPNTTVLLGADAAALYSVDETHDEIADKLGGIPYSSEFYAAIGTRLFRHILALYRVPPKVIVCDCDNTLWSGVVAEDGVDGLYIAGYNNKLHDILSSQKKKGMLLCLCSKNEKLDIVRAFEGLSGMRLGLDEFLAKRINWKRKSENLQSLSSELNVGLDSFIFVDDDPVECAEVNCRCPEVLTVELPREHCVEFLDHYWGFDIASATSESERRTVLYRENAERETYSKSFQSMNDFITSLELKISNSSIDIRDLQRVSELMYRTTQFNTTGMKMSMDELRLALNSRKLDGQTFRVVDKFGDYGLVGVCFYREENEDLVVDAMLLSCRALGRGVEYRMASECGLVAMRRGLSSVKFRVYETNRNRPAREFLESIVKHLGGESDSDLYSIPAVTVAALKPIYNKAIAHSDVRRPEVESVEIREVRSSWKHSSAAQFQRIAVSYRTARSIIEGARGRAALPIVNESFVAPRTPMECAVAEIWNEILGTKCISIDSDFFELGGDSMKAIRVLSRINGSFDVVLPVTVFFEQRATIETLCCLIDDALKAIEGAVSD